MKKLLIVLLTIAMVFGMSGTAFATENGNGNGYTDMSTVEITKNVSLKNNGTSNPAEVFGFEVEFVKLVRDGVTVENITAPEIADFIVKVEKGQSSGKGTLVLPDLSQFSGVGEYTFTITEKTGNTAGMSYNGGKKELVILILNDGNGFIRVVKKLANDEGKKIDAFENEFSAGKLEVSKKVTGNMGDKERYFKFTVTFIGDNVRDDIDVGSSTHEANPTTVEVGKPTDFYFKHGETINFSNIPYGVTYTVEEADYTGENDGYDAADYNFSDTAKKIDSDKDTVVITNDKDLENINVGVNLDNLPYILTLVLGLGGLVVFVMRKRIFN